MQLCETGKHPNGELKGGRDEKIRKKMKHSLMISWGKKEKTWLLRLMVLWEKCKHSYILYQQTSSLLVHILRLLFKSAASQELIIMLSPLDVRGCFDRHRRSQGNSAGPSGQPGLCSTTANCRERELVVQGTPSQAVGHMVDRSTSRPSPQHPWSTETERVLSTPLFIGSTSEQRMMG